MFSIALVTVVIAMMSSSFFYSHIHLSDPRVSLYRSPSELFSRLLIKIRHGPDLTASTIKWLHPECLQVTMDSPDRGVAPGQFAVFYYGDICLGAGVIENRQMQAH